MSQKVIDCCGLSCPEPVLRTRQAMQESGISELQVKLNTTVARDNVKRTAQKMGWKVRQEESEDHFLLILTK